MSINKAILFSFAILAFAGSVYAQSLESFVPNFKESDLNKINQDHDLVWKDVPKDQQKGWKQFKRWEYFWSQRLYPNATYKQAMTIYSEVDKEIKTKKYDMLQSNQWKLIGPIDNPHKYNQYIDSKGLGRINVARFHPTNPNEIWIGAASGGVWKTTDKGKTWSNFSFTQFLSLGVSDIAISPTDPKTVYVATGDADGSLGTANYYSSIGIIKTTDGGLNWEVTNIANILSDKNIISRLMVNPTNPDIVLAACIDGIYKTVDGGKTWKNTQGGNFRDLELKPDNNNFVYAATSQRATQNYIYSSNDFGDTWTKKYEIPLAGRIQLSVTPSQPDYLYVLCSQYQHSGFHSFLISFDSGETFDKVIDSTYSNLLNWGNDLGVDQRGQSYYDLALAVDLDNENNIVLGGIECQRSTDMGYTWKRSTNPTPYNASAVSHTDMHDLAYNPLNKELYLCNDGGIYVSKDKGITWTDLTSGLSITQYYKIGMSSTNPNLVIGGAQDNGTSMYVDGTWNMIYGGDGMDCAIDPNDDNTIYASVYNGAFVKSRDKGKTINSILNETILKTRYGATESGAWIAPFAINPQKSSTLYAGFNNVWKSNDYGNNWTKISKNSTANYPLTGLTVAPSDSNYIYTVINNNLYMTANGGTTWKQITVAPNTITSVIVSPNNPQLIWYSLSGYNAENKVMMYDGTKFTNLSGNLPNVPVNTIVYQKGTNDRLYIGTDIGIFYSENKSNIWDNINSNLPHLIISELEIFYGSEVPKLRAATYGRGLWEADVITCNVPELSLSSVSDTIKICPYEFAEISVIGDNSNYIWTNGTTGKTLKTNIEGTYSVSAMDGDCKLHSKTIDVVVIPTSSIVARVTGGVPACIGDTIELSATKGFKSYKWSTGSTEQTINIHQSGEYYVIGNKGTGCNSYSDTLKVTFVEKPSKPVFVAHGSRLIADSIAGYQWYLDGVAIQGATTRYYRAEKSGYYQLLGLNSAGCGTMSDSMFVEYSSVGDKITNSFTVSPNPSKGEFQLKLSCMPNDIVEYTVTNVAGERISLVTTRSNVEEFNAIINLEAQADGVYMLSVRVNNGNNRTVKLVKK